MIRFFTVAALAAFSLYAQSNAPIIVGADGKYLGRLSADPYAADSVSNPYGKYGSPYSVYSINNPYGKYGSQYSPYSPTNPYATQQAPVIQWNVPAPSFPNYNYLTGPSTRPMYCCR